MRDTTDGRPAGAADDPWSALIAGYRFALATDAPQGAAALAVRRSVYGEKVGAPIEVPDEFDARAWLLMATHVDSGEVVGTTRVVPRDIGPFECERYFDVPIRLKQGVSVEINRFAVLSAHRRRPDSLPPVSLGLFRLLAELCRRIRAKWVVIASREEQIETYRWLGFEQTGMRSEYGSLGSTPHELLWLDFGTKGGYEWHGLAEFFGRLPAGVSLPDEIPAPGAWRRRARRAATAGAES